MEIFLQVLDQIWALHTFKEMMNRPSETMVLRYSSRIQVLSKDLMKLKMTIKSWSSATEMMTKLMART